MYNFDITFESPGQVFLYVQHYLLSLSYTIEGDNVLFHDLSHSISPDLCPLCGHDGMYCMAPFFNPDLEAELLLALLQQSDALFEAFSIHPQLFVRVHPNVPLQTPFAISQKITHLCEVAQQRNEKIIGFAHDLSGYMNEQLVFPDEYLTTEEIIRNKRDYVHLICTDFIRVTDEGVCVLKEQPIYVHIQSYSLLSDIPSYWKTWVPSSLRSPLLSFLPTQHIQWRMNVVRDSLKMERNHSASVRFFYEEISGHLINASSCSLTVLQSIPQAHLRNLPVLFAHIEKEYQVNFAIREKMDRDA